MSNIVSRLLARAFAGAALTCICAAAQATLVAVPLYSDVPVSDIGTDNTLANSNTSRKLAIGADGTIYALFRSPTNGIRVARSTNRGQSFSPSVQVSTDNAEAELAIATDGDLHVAWVSSGSIVHSISRDGGVTYSAPVTAGSTASASVHMAVDGDRVYLIPRAGNVVFRSSDDGATFAQTSTGSSYAFADVFVDPVSRDVLVVADNPSTFFYVSTDFGQTFSGPTATGKSVFYSVGAFAPTDSGRYLFMAGSSTNLERFEIDTPAYFTATVPATAGSTTRSLSADMFGNVVTGYLESGALKFEQSNDLAATFGAPTTVVSGAARANAAINVISGDILFLYEKNNQIYLSTYSNGLAQYDINVAPSALNFSSTEVGKESSLPITLSNVSASAVAVASFTASAGFAFTGDCGGSIAVGATCTVTVKFAPTATGSTSGVLSLTLGGVVRKIPLTGTGIPPRLPTTTQLTSSASALPVGGDVTLTANVTGNAITGTVAFTESGAAVSGCSAVALSGSTASCVVSGLTAGAKQYSAAYSGDATNAPSTSSAVTVNVGTFTVTPSVGNGGSMNPSTPQDVGFGNTVSFTVTPNSGYRIDTVSGCGGALSGNTYSTGSVTANCTVTATFASLDETVDISAKSKGGGGAMDWLTLLMGALGLLARRLRPLLLSVLALGRAYAGEHQWFVGGAVGDARSEHGSSEVTDKLAQQGLTADSIDVSDRSRVGYRVFAGYRATPHWLVEVGYTDLGKASTSASATVPAGQAPAYARALLNSLPGSPSGYEASVSYRYPFNDALAATARGGLWHWKNKLRADFGDQSLSDSRDGTDAIYGVGLEWTVTTRCAVGAEVSRYRANGDYVDLLGANIKFLL
jgi:Bacterial Ig-like domain (group 3)/OmpA-like transmembrane domain/Abnormal spindle-like microcephaly-assoc'd, ASPM-SPD-2-Hydin/Divergent InlB B-repeat domain